MNKQVVSPLIKQAINNKKKHNLNKELYQAVKSNNYDEIKKLIEAGATIFKGNSKEFKLYSEDEDTPLHIATKNGFLNIIKLLVENGAIIDATNRKEQTPLHWAVHNGYSDIINYLLAHGADINAKENEGDSASKGKRKSLCL